MSGVGSSDPTYWRGGDGGDGVVIISYEVHGRDPIAEEPRIAMTRCEYDADAVTAAIDYRLYWAGSQTDLADIYIHYSTIGPDELTNSAAGGWVKVTEEATVGVGSFVFTPPEVGYTYWVNIVGRKDAGSFYYSDEWASFKVPAVELNGAVWTESKTSPDDDYATINYALFETNAVTHLFCYWSESESALQGDAVPSGEGVYLLDLGVGKYDATSFRVTASDGMERNRTYYIRLAAGDGQGLKIFLSDEIVSLDTAEKPVVVLNSASWANNAATVVFNAIVGKLDPAQTEVVALYSLVEDDVKASNPTAAASVTNAVLGLCSELALGSDSLSAMFPLWSTELTNYYVRLALATNGVIVNGSISQATKTISVDHAIEANTLIYIVTANPKIACYGDAVLPMDFSGPEFAGLTEGWGFENRYGLTGEMACGVTAASPSGNYPITQGTFNLVDGGQEKKYTDDGGVEHKYQYKLAFSEANYTITNAVFAVSIEDATFNYTGDACDTSGLVFETSGLRGGQTPSYQFRVGTNDWASTLPAFAEVGSYNVQFTASAPSHDDVRGTFMVTVAPAPLDATISVVDSVYTGRSQTPAISTNVTGLVRGDVNPLTCEFRDEAGEWQSEVPSFTMPGTYKVFFRVSAPNHTVFTTNCTFTIEGWDFKVNMDGDSGFQSAINVSDPGWFLRTTGLPGESFSKDTDRYARLDEICSNGLKLWQNYVIERDDLSKKLVAAIHQNCKRVAKGCFELRFPNTGALRNTGLDVRFRVDRKLKGESEFTLGELTDKYEVNVPLEPNDPTGLYVFNMVLIPTNGTGQAVLTSCSTVGVLRVSSTNANTVAAVPWKSMTFDTDKDVNIVANDVVNPNGLSDNDMIVAYDAIDDSFCGWKNVGNGTWEELSTVTTNGITTVKADDAELPRGNAFWLVRTNPDSKYFYLIGRYTGEDYVVQVEGGSESEPGFTLVANPTMFDVDLNSLVYASGSPSAKDTIEVTDAAGYKTIYYRNAANTEWGRTRTTVDKRGRIKREWEKGGNIPSGTGFWYNRRAEGAISIKFESSK